MAWQVKNINIYIHPPCRKYLENPKKMCRAQCKGYHSELCKYSIASREYYYDRCYRIHLKGTRHKPNLTCDPWTKYNSKTTNQEQAMIAAPYLGTLSGQQLPPTPFGTPTQLTIWSFAVAPLCVACSYLFWRLWCGELGCGGMTVHGILGWYV